jgi:hypothetical protein
MGAFFHIISTGGGAGASRATRYVAERDKDPQREGPGSRPLFSEDREGLSYRKADRILDPEDGRPEKNDLIHFSVSFLEEDFERLGDDEKERQARLREVIREGMRGVAADLNVERLTWVAGIHRNSDHPHAHVVTSKSAVERGTEREKRLGRFRKSLLAHREIRDGKEVVVRGAIADSFQEALERQQSLNRTRPLTEHERAQQIWKQMVDRIQQGREQNPDRMIGDPSRSDASQTREPSARTNQARGELSPVRAASSWNAAAPHREDSLTDYRLALGKQLEFRMRLAFAQVWYDRAVDHGDTYRFSVVDQSSGEERHISELDVHRRASARAQRLSQGDRTLRDEAIDADLSRHHATLQELTEARENKIASLQKDMSSMAAHLGTVHRVAEALDRPGQEITPLMDRATLSELQETAVRLNLPHHVSELEQLRMELAREFKSDVRIDDEAAKLAAQFNVARADFMARDARLESFEASLHLTPYEVHGERWSLAALDKQMTRRREDAKLVPDRAVRLDFRSLTRLNYSGTAREEAALEVLHLTFVRGEIVRQIEQRREPLVGDRDLAREMVGVLEQAHAVEQQTRTRDGRAMPDPKYEDHQVRSLEASAETLRDPQLLREVHSLERAATRLDAEPAWEGRAVAREITSSLAVAETRQRLEHFLESKRVASLHLGNHRTGNLRDVEARTLTEYLARAIETTAQRDHRHTVKLAAHEHHGRLVKDFEKAQHYHEAASELSREAKEQKPKFTDKEKINLEIYAERQIDPQNRERLMELARGSDSRSQEREVAASRSR